MEGWNFIWWPILQNIANPNSNEPLLNLTSAPSKETLWLALGLEQWWAEELARLGLCWCDGWLRVDEALAGEENLFGGITQALLFLLKFKKPTDSRWLTMSFCGKTFIAMQYAGILDMAMDCLKSGLGSEYYLGGVKQLDDRIIAFTAVNALGTGPAVAVTNCLLDDDRLLRNWDAVWEVEDFEMDYLFSLSDEFWQEVTAAMSLTDVDYILVRSWCCAAALTGASFGDFSCWQVLRSEPFCYGLGSSAEIDAKLQRLAASTHAAPDSATAKMRLLLQRDEFGAVKDGAMLMKDIRCSALSTEQAHSTEADVHKVRPGLEQRSLQDRAFAKLVKPFLVEEKTNRPLVRQAKKRLATLRRKRPNRFGGKQRLFQRAFTAEAMAAVGMSNVDQEIKQGLMAHHSAAFHMLDATKRAEMEDEARALRRVKAADIQDTIDHYTAALRLAEDRDRQEERERAEMMAVRNARLAPEAVVRLQAMLKGELWRSEAQVERRRQEVLQRHFPASAPLLADMSSVHTWGEARPPLPDCPSWLAQLCRRRDHMDLVAVRSCQHVPATKASELGIDSPLKS